MYVFPVTQAHTLTEVYAQIKFEKNSVKRNNDNYIYICICNIILCSVVKIEL